jgi:hypothetical protein
MRFKAFIQKLKQTIKDLYIHGVMEYYAWVKHHPVIDHTMRLVLFAVFNALIAAIVKALIDRIFS